MKGLLQYRIPFTGLKIGKHQFEYNIDARFFNEFDYSLVKDGDIKVLLEMDKQETMLLMHFRMTGTILLSCDVCLANYPFAVNLEERVIGKFGEDEGESETEEIVIIGRNDHEIDVSTLIYEYINLYVPYINRCADEGNTAYCDSEMISRLKALSGDKEEKNEVADPRWEALKKIKNN